jgi:16S rRNA G527 N7-methylase RsmG
VRFVETFDFVVARAVTDLRRLYGLAYPFLRSRGRLIAIKGSKLEAEVRGLRETAPTISVTIEPLPIRVKSGEVEQRFVSVEKTEAWVL